MINKVGSTVRIRLHTTFWVAVACLVVATGPVVAQPYTQLQVLLPGETAAPGTGSGKTGAPSDQTVGVAFNATIRAVDASWNTVTSITNAVSLSSSDVTATIPGSISLSGGAATVQVTINAAGSFTFATTDDSDPTIPEATSANVTAFLLDGFEFSKINQKNQYAGVPMNISVSAVDPVGNVVSGYSGEVSFREKTSFGDGRIEPATVALQNGTWSGSVTMYRADETSINRGNVNIEAYIATSPAISGLSDPFSVHPGVFSKVQIVVPGQDPWPGSLSGVSGSAATQSAGQGFAVDVYATDDYWNPVPSSDVVRITSSDGAASTPVNASLTGGFAQTALSLGTVGTQTLTVNDMTNGSIQGTTSAGIAVIASAPDHFEFDTITGPIVAGTTVPITIRAVDVSNNTITDFTGTAILVANTGPGSISPESIQFSAGVWTGGVEFRGAGGAVSLSCSDYSTPPHIGTSNPFQVTAAAYAGLQVIAAGESPAGGTASGKSGTPDVQAAGTSFNLTVRAVDAYWNRVSGINSRVALTSTDLFATMPAETTLVNGELVFPITMFKAGMQTVSATDADTPSINGDTSSEIEVTGGTYSRVLLIAPGEEVAPGTAEGRTGLPTDQSINFAFTVTVYATDEWFNPVGGVSDVVRITSNDPLAELPPDAPLNDGVALMNVRLSTGGFQQITASNVTQPAMPTSTTDVRAISSGLHLEAEVTPTNVAAGEPFTLTVKVTNDAGSVIQEINSAVTIEVQNASTQALGRGTLRNTSFQLLQGQRSMQEDYTFAEDIVLVVRDDAGNTPAVTEVISVSPGAPAEIQLSSNPSWVPGNKTATVTARLVDAFDNGVPSQPVVFSIVTGAGTLTGIDSLTTAGGTAAAEFRAPRFPDVARLRAASGIVFAEMDLETAFVDPSEQGGYVTNYPNPFHPGESSTTIAYKLDDNATVTLRVYTLTGSLVLEKKFPKGDPGGVVGLNEFAWDGRNGDGTIVASGGYIVFIKADGNGETLHKMRRKVGVVR